MTADKLKEQVNLAGSVASLTGISLLWLRNLVPQSSLAVAIPIFAIASLLSVGVCALAWVLFEFGRELFFGSTGVPPSDRSLPGLLAYTGIVGGLLLIGTIWLVILIFWTGKDAVASILR